MITATADAINLIKRFEGLRTKAYVCPAGVLTIGYGHTEGVKKSDVITEKQADEYLKSDIAKFSEDLNKALNADEIELQNVHQFDALVCFVFNVGEYALFGSKSTPPSILWKKLKAKDYQGAAEQFGRWNKAKVNGKYVVLNGLTKRRYAEYKLFTKED